MWKSTKLFRRVAVSASRSNVTPSSVDLPSQQTVRQPTRRRFRLFIMRPPLALAAEPLLRAVVLFITTGFLTGISAQLTRAQDSDRFPIIRSDKLGFIDGNGREVIAPQFGNAGDAARFRVGMANIVDAGGGCCVDASSRFV